MTHLMPKTSEAENNKEDEIKDFYKVRAENELGIIVKSEILLKATNDRTL